ncbi:MAG: phenylalanine--tRNA ligase subunit beta, partial [Clostridiales bacterium]|nr:phenylalanine--tRNA ligase subunit beta [Clostridiales bacterium]
PKTIDFDSKWINCFLGTDIPEVDMIKYLTSLGFIVKNNKVTVPSFRIDVEGKADIAEEVARIYGYNNIPSTAFRGVAQSQLTPIQKFTDRILSGMVSLGCYEIATYSFISPKYFDKINLPEISALRNTITIANPLGEETSIMRTTTIPSMLEVLSRNYNNRNDKAKLFEVGKEYIPTTPDTLPEELLRLTIGLYGGNADFYELKGIIIALLDNLGIEDFELVRCHENYKFDEASAFHPGRSAVIVKDGLAFGIFGEVHPSVIDNYEIDAKTYVAKLNVPEMMEIAKTEITYKPLPKYPATTRDLSLVCDDEIPVANIEKIIKKAVGQNLEKVTLFDVYKGKQIEQGKKSVSYSISMRSHEGTLTDEQADIAMNRVLKSLAEMGAELRM